MPAIQIALMYFLPETPAWLIRHDQVDVGTETVIWLFGDDHNLITLALLTNEAADSSNSKLVLFTEAKYRTPFLLCIVSMFYQQFSGINAIVSVLRDWLELSSKLTNSSSDLPLYPLFQIFYTSTILDAAKSTIDPNLATIYIGLAQFFTVIISCFLVDRFGRKILLNISSIGTGIAMLSFSL